MVMTCVIYLGKIWSQIMTFPVSLSQPVHYFVMIILNVSAFMCRCNHIDWKYEKLRRNNSETSITALKAIESLTELFTNFAKTG